MTEIGPYALGDSLRLRCVSKQGRPLANVTWWSNNSVLIDNSFETQSEGSEAENVINDLEITKLDRYHNEVILTCRASNDIQVPPADASVQSRMHCKYKKADNLLDVIPIGPEGYLVHNYVYCKLSKYLL